jgi:transposase InsO family protein
MARISAACHHVIRFAIAQRITSCTCIARSTACKPQPRMLHIDGSQHQRFQDEGWHDLIVVLDDATSEIHYAQLVEEESTPTMMAALRRVIERKGISCALYSDRGSHFWLSRPR